MIEAHLPKGLKRLSIFEDYNDDFITVLQGSIEETYLIRIAEPTVGAAFAYRSLDLEQLSVSFMVDAWQFFQARQPLWTWDQLQSLVLTSQLLTQTDDRGKVSDLLEDAGAAALHMPKLHTMALWNGGKGQALRIYIPSGFWENFDYLAWYLGNEPGASCNPGLGKGRLQVYCSILTSG